MRYALVTGGSGEIGKAICEKLSEMDYHVLINYNRNKENAQKTLESIVAKGGSGEIIQFDVSNRQTVTKSIESWKESTSCFS